MFCSSSLWFTSIILYFSLVLYVLSSIQYCFHERILLITEQFHSFWIMVIFHKVSYIQSAFCSFCCCCCCCWIALCYWTLTFDSTIRELDLKASLVSVASIAQRLYIIVYYLKTEHSKECIRCCRQNAGTPRRLQYTVPPGEIPGRSLCLHVRLMYIQLFLVPYGTN